MNIRVCLKYLGIIYSIAGIAMAIPIAFGIFFKEEAVSSLFISMAIALVVGAALFLPYRNCNEYVLRKEGFFIVTFAWAGAAVLGALPLIISGSLPHPIDAYFEAISGFTTTGSTVITDLTIVPKCILLWRSQTQWLGGMGIIVLVVALFSMFGKGGKSMFYSEAPGVYRTGILPRIQDSAQKLWMIYVAFTLLEVAFLMFGGLSFYEALLHSFSTMATGGFSNHNESIAFYQSPYIQWVFIAFMILAGMNFGLYYTLLLNKKMNVFFRDYEWKLYMAILLVSSALVMAFLVGGEHFSLFASVRPAVFQVVSLVTTTGFATEDFDQWPEFTRLLLVIIMFIGGCTGSTGGGMKVFRVIVVVRSAWNELYKMFHPTAILSMKLGSHRVDKNIQTQVMGFFAVAVFLFAGISLFLTAFGVDIVTAFSATAATLWNIGPGLSEVGAVRNFAELPYIVKSVLSFAMLAGRLELFTVLVLFSPRFWRT